MRRHEIDRIVGTPCLCGDIDTWHPQCYAGKSKTEIAAGYDMAYRIARRKLKARIAEQVQNTIDCTMALAKVDWIGKGA